MTIEILVPDLPESVADAMVATWHKQPGERVERDEVLVDIETDKVVLEVPAPESGILESILEEEGSTVLSKQLLARIKPGAVAGEPTKDTAELTEASPDKRHSASLSEESSDALSPTVRRLLAEHGLEASVIKGSGVGGRITREDIDAYLAKANAQKNANTSAPAAPLASRSEKRVPMTRLRKRVAERLLEAKNSTAMLTTFNEVNMKPIMDLRAQYKDLFDTHYKKYGYSFEVPADRDSLVDISKKLDNKSFQGIVKNRFKNLIGKGGKVGSNSVVVKDLPENATAVGIPARIVNSKNANSLLDSELSEKLNGNLGKESRDEAAKKFGFDAYAVSADNPDPVAKAIGRLLDHMHLMDDRVSSICKEVNQLGGNICPKNLPELKVGEFDEDEKAAAKRRESKVESFDPEI